MLLVEIIASPESRVHLLPRAASLVPRRPFPLRMGGRLADERVHASLLTSVEFRYAGRDRGRFGMSHWKRRAAIGTVAVGAGIRMQNRRVDRALAATRRCTVRWQAGSRTAVRQRDDRGAQTRRSCGQREGTGLRLAVNRGHVNHRPTSRNAGTIDIHSEPQRGAALRAARRWQRRRRCARQVTSTWPSRLTSTVHRDALASQLVRELVGGHSRRAPSRRAAG